MTPQDKQAWTRHLVNTVITSAGTLAIAWFGFISDMRQTTVAEQSQQTDQLQIAFNRIAQLEGQIKAMNDNLRTLQVENAILKARLGAEWSEDPTIIAILSSLDTPAWVKEYDPVDEVYKMLYINPAHEGMYGIDVNAYRGRTDDCCWPATVVESFRTNDELVYARKDFERVEELVVDKDGNQRTVTSLKFYVLSPSGREFIFGIQIEDIH